MHGHNRTLLASLGFADPDKHDGRHDLACQYLALPENHKRIAHLLLAERSGSRKERVTTKNPMTHEWVETEFNFERSFDHVKLLPPVLERPISKGEGKYKTTIGFVDVWLPFTCVQTDRGTRDGWRKENVAAVPRYVSAQVPYERDLTPFPVVCVEVKIGKVGVGEVLRQVSLYREYFEYFGPDTWMAWLLATPYPMDEHDAKTLLAAKIRHIRLGPKFEEWVTQRRATQKIESPEF